jgi:hypothetical protein
VIFVRADHRAIVPTPLALFPASLPNMDGDLLHRIDLLAASVFQFHARYYEKIS